MRLLRPARDRPAREQVPNEAELVPFLKRPDTSSHGSTLGLCDSLHAKEHSPRRSPSLLLRAKPSTKQRQCSSSRRGGATRLAGGLPPRLRHALLENGMAGA